MNMRHCLPKVVAVVASAVLAAASSCFGTVLSVTQRNQEKNQWCWDASSQMILEYYGHWYSQTDIAQWAVGGTDVANYLFNSPDPTKFGVDKILLHFGSISNTGSFSAMSLSTLTDEIDGSRPVLVRWLWDAGGGHIVVAHGTDGNTVYLRDPWPANGPTVTIYSWVCRPYGRGTWNETLQIDSRSPNESYYYRVAANFMEAARWYFNEYAKNHDKRYLHEAYSCCAAAAGYYYLNKGQTSNAWSSYYYYEYLSEVALMEYYFELWQSTGNYVFLANAYSAYGSAYYNLSMSVGNTKSAQYYINLGQYYYYKTYAEAFVAEWKSTGSYYTFGYACYYYADALWYYYLCLGDIKSAQYYHKLYMDYYYYYTRL